MSDELLNELKSLKRAIQNKCYDCSGRQTGEVEKCALVPVYNKRTLVMGCPLWPFREGAQEKTDSRKLKQAKVAYEKVAQAKVGLVQ